MFIISSNLTINALQYPPGGRFGGLWPDAVDSLRTKSQQEDEDYCDQEAGEQQGGHDDDLLLVHSDLCEQERTQPSLSLSMSEAQCSCARLSTLLLLNGYETCSVSPYKNLPHIVSPCWQRLSASDNDDILSEVKKKIYD